MTIQDTPNFAAWSNANLANFANESYHRLRAQEEAIEQLRLDLRTAMQRIRELTTQAPNTGDDWK